MNAKPENHGGRALAWEEFLSIVADGVAHLNARPGRRTEAAAGRSFDETWEAETAALPVRRLSQEQAALLLMAVESTKVQRSGVFRLKAGSGTGIPRNQYYHQDFTPRRPRTRASRRFSPLRRQGRRHGLRPPARGLFPITTPVA